MSLTRVRCAARTQMDPKYIRNMRRSKNAMIAKKKAAAAEEKKE